MKIKAWGSGEVISDKPKEKEETDISKVEEKIIKRYREQKAEYNTGGYEPNHIDIKPFFFLISIGVIAVFIFLTLPTMINYFSDFDLPDINPLTANNDKIPDDVVFTLVVRDGSKSESRIIYVFNTTKGELVRKNVCYVNSNIELSPINDWEPWRCYLTNDKGFKIPNDNIFVEIYPVDYYWHDINQ